MNNEKTQTGMDFPHDFPRPNGKKAVATKLTAPKPNKKDRKRLHASEKKVSK